MYRNVGALLVLIFSLVSCTSSQRETAIWVGLTPIAIIVGPVVVVSQFASDALSRDKRAEEWRAVTNPIYRAKVEQIENWSPVEDATRFWSENEVVYWRSNRPGMKFTGLDAGIDRQTILSNYEVYSMNPELRTRAEALANELVGIGYPRDYKELNGAAYACFEEVAANYQYLFNVQMASLTGEYEPLPDYREEITMDMENPCAHLP